MIWWLWATAAVAADCDPNESVVRGLQAWLAKDAPGARVALDEAVVAYGCSPIAEPQTLARYWLLDGVLLAAAGEREESTGSFAAARRVAPDVWLQQLGPEPRTAWSTAEAPPGTGTIRVDPLPPRGLLWFDGVSAESPEVPAGLHLVQVGAPDRPEAFFATVVWVDPSVSVRVEVPPVPVPAASVPVIPVPVVAPEPLATYPALPEPDPAIRLEVHALTGASAALGTADAHQGDREPQFKVAVPLDLGIGVAGGLGFARLQFGGAFLVDGRYLARTADGEAIARTTRFDVGAAAGLGDSVRVGIAGGVQWPSRIAGRLLLGWSPIAPLVGELRLGANFTTAQEIEPAVELLIGVRR